MPLTIHDPASAPMSNNNIMADVEVAMLFIMPFSISAQDDVFLIRDIATTKADAVNKIS